MTTRREHPEHRGLVETVKCYPRAIMWISFVSTSALALQVWEMIR